MSWLIAFASQSGWGVAVEGAEPQLFLGGAAAARHELTVSPLPDAAVSSADGTRDRLSVCRVTAGELDTIGVRTEIPSERFETVRLVVACFSPEHVVGLVATRPQGAKGHDRDAVSVVSLGEREGMTVFDPRLSTTYGGDGTPRRVGIELWLGESEDGEQYPHRVAAETSGERLDGERLRAYGLGCHSRGEDGAGVYVLLSAR